MINQNTLASATELAELICKSGRVAVPVPDTPLDVLCNHSTVTGIVVGEDPSAKLLAESNNTAHNRYQDEYITTVARAASNHVDFAKNVVNPSIREVAQYVGNKLADYTNVAMNDIRVVRVTLPDPLWNGSLKSDLYGLAHRGMETYLNPSSYFSLPNHPTEELLELITTGSSNLDVAIRTWALGQSEGFLNDVWERFFADPKTHGSPNTDMLSYLNEPVVGYQRALAVYLFSRKLKNEGVDGTKENTVEFNSRVKQYQTTSSVKVREFMERYKSAEDRGLIVLHYDYTNKIIYTYANTYLEWLEAGNSPEVLYGAFIQGESYSDTKSLGMEREALLKSWQVYKSALNNEHRNSYYVAYLQALRDGFWYSMRNLLESEQEFHDSNSNAKDQIARLLEEELKYITIEDRKDHYRTATRLVCKARYYYTDVYKFLCTVDSLTKDETVSLEEALHTATIEYVTDYVSSQLVVR